MSERGLTAQIHEDVSKYEAPISIIGIRMPKRMAISLGAAIAINAVIGCYVGFGLGMDASNLMVVYIVVAIAAFLLGFRERNGLRPEVYLPHVLRNRLQGRKLIRETRSISKGDRTYLSERIQRDKSYRKALKKRGARKAEIYLPRLEEAEARLQEGICEETGRAAQESA